MDRPPGTVRSRVASGVAKLRARRAAGRQSGINNTHSARSLLVNLVRECNAHAAAALVALAHELGRVLAEHAALRACRVEHRCTRFGRLDDGAAPWSKPYH